MISLVVACDANGLIGKKGWMPWHLPEDLKHFKKITLHKHILMGRKTYEAIGKPLPQRKTFVLTHRCLPYEDDNVEVIHDVHDVVKRFIKSEEELVVCGGAQIYECMLPYVTEMWVSRVNGEYDGDTYFPKVDWNCFALVEKIEKEGFVIEHYRKDNL